MHVRRDVDSDAHDLHRFYRTERVMPEQPASSQAGLPGFSYCSLDPRGSAPG
jgi:hypothetical protein